MLYYNIITIFEINIKKRASLSGRPALFFFYFATVRSPCSYGTCFVECIIIPLYLLVNYVFMFFGKIYFAALLPVNASAAVLTISVLYIAALFLAYGFLFNRKTISCKTMRNLQSVFFKLTRQSPRSRASTDFGSLLA